MAVAFVVSAYRHPLLLRRLVDALEGRRCAIHVDAKVDAAPFSAALSGLPNVALLPRHVCHWGGFGHVEASLEGLRWFLRTGLGHVALLTGQCYPLRPIGDLDRWLADHTTSSVITHDAFPHPRWRNGGWDRIRRTHLRLGGRAWHLRLIPRRLPMGWHPYGGSSYWCLSRAAAQHVIDTVDRSPELVRFFRRVWIPDEIFFQTVLANSPLRETLINDDIHYIEWVAHQPSPKIITDPTAALASGKWFARKFDDPSVLDRIDQKRSGRPEPHADASVNLAS